MSQNRIQTFLFKNGKRVAQASFMLAWLHRKKWKQEKDTKKKKQKKKGKKLRRHYPALTAI